MSPHNRDMRPKILYTLSSKCVSKLNTQHSPLRKYVRTYIYVQGILLPTLLCHTPHTLSPHTHNPHTHTSHPPSSHPHPSPSFLTHISHLPSSHIRYTPPSSPALLVQGVQETCWLLSDQLKTDRVVSEGDGIPHNALTHVLLLQTHTYSIHIRTVV